MPPLAVEQRPIALDRVGPRGVLTFDDGAMSVRTTNLSNLGGHRGARLPPDDRVNLRLTTDERTMRETTVISTSNSLIAPMTRVAPSPPITPKHSPPPRPAPVLIRQPPTFATPAHRPVRLVGYLRIDPRPELRPISSLTNHLRVSSIRTKTGVANPPLPTMGRPVIPSSSSAPNPRAPLRPAAVGIRLETTPGAILMSTRAEVVIPRQISSPPNRPLRDHAVAPAA